jgi:single-strand DNA-binding protein
MYQTIIIVGNLGGDPEMRYTPSGQPVTNFSVAASRSYTGADGAQVKETTWFRISVWGKQAESASKYLKKGNRVLIEGRLNPDQSTGGPRIWTRQDGTSAASFEVTASTVRFLTPKSEGGEGAPEPAAEMSGEEIPF